VNIIGESSRSTFPTTGMAILVSSIVLLLALLFLACSNPTEPEATDNPYLRRLAVGEPYDGFPHGGSVNFPVWSPDGSSIYYLNILGIWSEGILRQNKQIRKIDASGGESEVVMEGNFIYLAISPDGSKLASNIDNGGRAIPLGRGKPVIIDIASKTVDTLDIDAPLESGPVRFSITGDSLFFYAFYIDSIKGSWISSYYWGAFFVYDLNNGTCTKLFEENPYLVAGFDITPDGQKIVASGKIRNIDGSDEQQLTNVGIWQTISPDGNYVVGGFGRELFRGNYVSLTYLPDDSLIRNLDLFADPAALYGEFSFSPDGNKIAFAVCVAWDPFSYGNSFICVLDQI